MGYFGGGVQAGSYPDIGSPVLWYKCADASGQTTVANAGSAGAGSDLTLVGTENTGWVLQSNGLYQYTPALEFLGGAASDGAYGTIAGGVCPANSSYTLLCAFRPGGVTTTGQIPFRVDDASTNNSLGSVYSTNALITGVDTFKPITFGDNYVGGVNLSTNAGGIYYCQKSVWQTSAVVWNDASSIQIWIGGVLIGSVAHAKHLPAMTRVGIGNVNGNGTTDRNTPFHGWVGDCRLYTSALSAAQIRSYHQGQCRL